MNLRKIAYYLHLWIGMISGIIVFIVCITGAIWGVSIYGWIGSSEQEKGIKGSLDAMLKPSQLSQMAEEVLGGPATYIYYTEDAPASIGRYGKGVRASASINPLTGEVFDEGTLSVQSREGKKRFNFWTFIRNGHRALWLPYKIGRPIVNYATFAFVIVLITGIIIWAPKSKKAIKNKFTLNWKKNTPLFRKLFDVHSVLGFYSVFILLMIAFTGMVWGLEWWSKGVYKLTSGGKELPAWQSGVSDTLNINTEITTAQAVDLLFDRLIYENPDAEGVSINYPDDNDPAATIGATVSLKKNLYYNADRYTFDRYTLKEIKLEGPFHGKYEDKSFADKLRRMNYEIHIGTIAGLPGKLLVFFGALFGASLPITGFYLYYKKWKMSRKTRKT